MNTRDADNLPVLGDVSLIDAPNWTAVVFFALLATLHYSFATISLFHGRWEAYLSLVMGTLFTALSVSCHRYRHVVAVKPGKRIVCVSSSLFCWSIQRHVRFADIEAVRLTLFAVGRKQDSRIELICRDHNNIECPASNVPTQQALYLSIAIGVPLQRVSADAGDDLPEAAVAGSKLV